MRSLLLSSAIVAGACASDHAECLGSGAVSAYAQSDCETRRVLSGLNDPLTSSDRLVHLGLGPDLADAIVRYRVGPDGVSGTLDDGWFSDLGELGANACLTREDLDALFGAMAQGFCPETDQVVFSPQADEDSHLTRIAAQVEAAQSSIDLALYGLGDATVEDALARAVSRGVQVRLLYDGIYRWGGDSTSEALAAAGVDVRWVDRTLHDKFGIFDGPRWSTDAASAATVVHGSANWSSSAATTYDENTVFITDRPAQALAFQAEFETLWANSRPYTDDQPLLATPSIEIDPSEIPADPETEVVFTSANFEPVTTSDGPGFSYVSGSTVAADRWVALISQATRSIAIASDHLRLPAVARALVEKKTSAPDVDIRIYVDQLEFVGESEASAHLAEIAACLDDADADPDASEACREDSFEYAFYLSRLGIPVRYKITQYAWNIDTSALMHDKYILVDDEILGTGSFNVSQSSEESLETFATYTRSGFPELLDAVSENFEAIWETGRRDGRYDAYMSQLTEGGGTFSLVYSPMALDWEENAAFLDAIATACPDAVQAVVDGEEPEPCHP